MSKHTNRYTKNELDTIRNFYWSLPLRLWPESLKSTQVNVGKRIGSCADVMSETIEAWIINGRRELTADEVFNTWKAPNS